VGLSIIKKTIEMKKLQLLSDFSGTQVEGKNIYGGAGGRTFEICCRETNNPSDEYACGDESTTCTNDDGDVYHESSLDKYCV
jgi:hypothetical protein